MSVSLHGTIGPSEQWILRFTLPGFRWGILLPFFERGDRIG
nr:MAG TPA: hypothetical protein [Caudoviricetes sp.]